MIEINLLPGSGKKKSRGARAAGSGVNLGALIGGIVGKVSDPWLVGAMAASIAVVAGVGMLHVGQTARARTLTERQQQAVQDSTRYATVLNEKRRAEAQRDSVLRQLNVIRSIDNNRFVWPHLLDEISRALPPYTWLTSVRQTNTPISAAARAVEPAAPARGRPAARPAAGAAAPPPARAAAAQEPVRDTIKFQRVGNTVDIQAMTRFMSLLEASPFIEGVELTRSLLVIENGKEVTQFVLEARYEEPEASLIRRVPLTLTMAR
ncbi:MAG TPA: hypothetical protein VMM18_03300 [Gemmatimonadaceae bacterium]|nr:hypothetical protein [Gemmatimonadaceae bacterium]